MSDGPIVRRISFDIHGEFITQLAREWFYTGEKSHEKVIEILMDSMTGTDTPEAQMLCIAETMQEATRKHCASFRQELKCITMVITPHTTE